MAKAQSRTSKTSRNAPPSASSRVATAGSQASKALTTVRTAVREPLARAERTLSKRTEQGMETAKRELRSAAKTTTRLAKEHPAVAAGALVGVGLLVGAVAQRAMRKQPTLGEVLMKTISSRAGTASKVVAQATRQGLKSAAKKIKSAR